MHPKIRLDIHIDDTYIPKKNEKIQCNKLSNYNTGGTMKTIDQDLIPSTTNDLFIKLSKDIGLNIFTIDLIASDITKEIDKQDTFTINELEYYNAWRGNYVIKDEFYVLSKLLILKWMIYMYILKKIYDILHTSFKTNKQ